MEDELLILREKVASRVVENPLDRLRVRLRCQKKQFSKEQAERVVKRAQKSRRNYRRECRVYYCKECKAHHVTSKE